MSKKSNKDAAAKVAQASPELTPTEATEAQTSVEPGAEASTPTESTGEASKKLKAEHDYVVVSRFMDKTDHSKTYEIGDSVNRFGAERLEDLIGRGLVERRIKE